MAAAEPIELRARAVAGDWAAGRVELADDVEVRWGRYLVVGDRLALERTPRGVVVSGDGRLLLCPCASSPVALRASSLRLAPPGDVFLSVPRVELGGVPVLVTPWLWLRSPDRPGLLPPSVAWRGADGLFAGAGVHVPLGAGGAPPVVDLRAGAYVRGGAELQTIATTRDAVGRLVWDHRVEDRVVVDARGYLGRDGAGASWDVDSLRGARALRGTIELDEAARGWDRARGAMSATGSMVAGGVAFDAVAPRGGSGWLAGGALAPFLVGAVGGALGAGGGWSERVAGGAISVSDGAVALARAEGEASGSARLGPLDATVRARHAVAAAEDEGTHAVDLGALAGASLSLPLARPYGYAGAPWLHVIEPRVDAAALARRTTGAWWTDGTGLLAPGRTSALATAGARTAVGPSEGARGAALDVAAGAVGDRALARARGAARSGPIAIALDAAAVLARSPGSVGMVRARWGDERRASLAARVSASRGVDPVEARLALAGDAPDPGGAFRATTGIAAGADASVPLALGFRARAGGDADLDARQVLAIRTSLAWTHACRCLAVGAWASRRVGREGLDAWLSIDLAP